MGLDMYLRKEYYIGAEYEHRKVKGDISIEVDGKKVVIDFNKVSTIRESFAYWRKANQIHAWFVENIQDGTDDCGDYYVSAEQLTELVETCKKVLKNKKLAEELLPTQSGFFFGVNEDNPYDEFYFQDLSETVEQLKDIENNSVVAEYYYRSSW